MNFLKFFKVFELICIKFKFNASLNLKFTHETSLNTQKGEKSLFIAFKLDTEKVYDTV